MPSTERASALMSSRSAAASRRLPDRTTRSVAATRARRSSRRRSSGRRWSSRNAWPSLRPPHPVPTTINATIAAATRIIGAARLAELPLSLLAGRRSAGLVRCRTYVLVVGDAPVIQQAFRFALDPTVEQEQFLAACVGASRFWFNQGLALVKRRLDERAAGADVDVPWSYEGLCVAFRGEAIKDELAPWRGEVVTGSYQAGLEALGKALQNFSAARKAGRQVGFPRFRAKGRGHEAVIFQRPRLADSRHVLLDRRLGRLRAKE